MSNEHPFDRGNKSAGDMPNIIQFPEKRIVRTRKEVLEAQEDEFEGTASLSPRERAEQLIAWVTGLPEWGSGELSLNAKTLLLLYVKNKTLDQLEDVLRQNWKNYAARQNYTKGDLDFIWASAMAYLEKTEPVNDNGKP